jgi:pSer/pThr/pTyr-binding forkhead associated (FHA) protein
MVESGPLTPLQPHTATPAELQERLERDRGGRPYLLYRDGDGVQQLHVLAGDSLRITLGRSPDADVPVTWDREVSRHHAMVERTVDGWSVVDDGRALNGTFVNGERLRGRRRLCDGDLVQIGATTIAYRDPRNPSLSLSTVPAQSVPDRIQISEAQRRVLVALCRPFGERRPFPTAPTNQQIAAELVLSVDAVKTHLRALFQRFGLDGLPRAEKRARLIERAFQTGTVGHSDFES